MQGNHCIFCAHSQANFEGKCNTQISVLQCCDPKFTSGVFAQGVSQFHNLEEKLPLGNKADIQR